MSLFSELDGARLVVTDEERGLLFVWHGGTIVNILDENGRALDAFSMSASHERTLDIYDVSAAIEAHRQALQEDES